MVEVSICRTLSTRECPKCLLWGNEYTAVPLLGVDALPILPGAERRSSVSMNTQGSKVEQSKSRTLSYTCYTVFYEKSIIY